MEETKKLLMKHPEIDGIFVANDLMGVGVLKAAKALHIKVPDDLSVISFDGIALGEMITPSLTTMAQPIYDLGARAAEMLIKRIKNPNQKIINEEIEVELIVRESTRARSKDNEENPDSLYRWKYQYGFNNSNGFDPHPR